ncbi:MAG: Mov34/MPN/PAD family protein [Phycisphaerales bacterium]|nr:Mov34/MPN/PAD family protein [Phycisphaerales bacterium]
MIQLSAQARQAMLADCTKRRPEEACGLMLGSMDGDEAVIRRVVSMENVWPVAEERLSRYALDPLAQMRAEQAAVADGLDLVGIYHSHPRGPAAPSGFDNDRAWPRYTYIIVGFEDPANPAPRAWVLDADGTFQEHQIKLANEAE